MNIGAFSRHGVNVECTYEEVPGAGLGQGATFRLDLPLKAVQAVDA
jgi:hypothetical protein